jgi:hypothetical protein
MKLRSPKNSQERPLAPVAPLLNESAERRDTGAGTDHDDVPIGRRKGEKVICAENRNQYYYSREKTDVPRAEKPGF